MVTPTLPQRRFFASPPPPNRTVSTTGGGGGHTYHARARVPTPFPRVHHLPVTVNVPMVNPAGLFSGTKNDVGVMEVGAGLVPVKFKVKPVPVVDPSVWNTRRASRPVVLQGKHSKGPTDKRKRAHTHTEPHMTYLCNAFKEPTHGLRNVHPEPNQFLITPHTHKHKRARLAYEHAHINPTQLQSTGTQPQCHLQHTGQRKPTGLSHASALARTCTAHGLSPLQKICSLARHRRDWSRPTARCSLDKRAHIHTYTHIHRHRQTHHTPCVWLKHPRQTGTVGVRRGTTAGRAGAGKKG